MHENTPDNDLTPDTLWSRLHLARELNQVLINLRSRIFFLVPVIVYDRISLLCIII